MILRREIIGDALLIQGDALGALLELEPIGAQALITDPPYCSGGFTEAAKRGAKCQGLSNEGLDAYGWFQGDNMTSAGLAHLLRSIAVAFKRHAADGSATLSFFCDWRMVPILSPSIESAGLRFQGMPVWDKGYAGMGVGFRAQHECVLHYAVDRARYFSRSFGNVLKVPRVRAVGREHPTEKPVDLMLKLQAVQTGPGCAVVDPFMGSGTTGVAAVIGGRRFVGIEQDPVHFDAACRRIEAAYREQKAAA